MNFIKEKKTSSKYSIGISVACAVIYASALFWRYGTGKVFIQGLVLLFVLMYASISDIRSRTVGNFLSVEILILALIYLPADKILSSLAAAIIIFILQVILMSWIPMGGGDVKITTAAAFLLGIEKGIIFYLIGFMLAMLYGIGRSLIAAKTNEGIPMIPFFSIAILIMFLV